MKIFETDPHAKNQAHLFPWLAVLAVLLAYLPVVDNPFVNWDDPNYIQYNLYIRHLNLSSVGWMLKAFYAGFWMPLTWLSLAVDFSIGRLEPWVYHLDNLLLHLINTALVFQVSRKFLSLVTTGNPEKRVWAAFGTALLFGLHPIHVESVAWASERKDLLCGLFFLLSLWTYLNYAAQARPNLWKYFMSLGFFILALLSKPMAVSLPLVLVLLDWWPLKRLQVPRLNRVLEKVPFAAAALASSAMAVLSQSQAGAVWSRNDFPLLYRSLNACHSLVFYLVKMVFPTNLAAFYPLLLKDIFSPEYVLSFLAVLLITLACFVLRRRYPFLAAAWIYFGLTLAPVSGILQVGNQAAADRFTYLPSFGLFLLASSLLVHWFSKHPLVLVFLAVLGSAFLGYGTWKQVHLWGDPVALWENVLRVCPENNLVVHYNLAKAYEDAGRREDALVKLDDAMSGQPFFYPYWQKGKLLAGKGFWDESIRYLKQAMSMNSGYPPLYADLGMAYGHKGMGPEALAEVQKAIQLDPRYSDGYNDLGLLYLKQGDGPDALKAFQTARSLDPDNPDYLRNLISAYRQAGEYKEAMDLYRELSAHPRSLLAMNF